MVPISRRDLLASLLVLPTALRADSDWMPLFDGRTLHGWKAGENSRSFRVVDGQIAASGPRSHLFYTGRMRNASFKNFELRAEVMPQRGGRVRHLLSHRVPAERLAGKGVQGSDQQHLPG